MKILSHIYNLFVKIQDVYWQPIHSIFVSVFQNYVPNYHLLRQIVHDFHDDDDEL